MSCNYIKKLLTVIILIEIPCIINTADSTQTNIHNSIRPLVVNRPASDNNRNNIRNRPESNKENTSPNLKSKTILRSNEDTTSNTTKMNKITLSDEHSNVSKFDLFKIMCKVAAASIGKETQPVAEEHKALYDELKDKMKPGNYINVPQIKHTQNEEKDVTRKKFEILCQAAKTKLTGVLNDVPEENQPLVEAVADSLENNAVNVIGSIIDNSSREQHEQVANNRINFNAISVSQDVIPEKYKDSFTITTLTDTYKSDNVKHISEIPIYTRNGLSNLNITGVAKTYDITPEAQAEADKARQVRQTVVEIESGEREEDKHLLLENKNKFQSNAADNTKYNTDIKEEEINTDIPNEDNGNVQTEVINTDIDINTDPISNNDTETNNNQDINTDDNTQQDTSSQPKKKLKPKTILRAVKPLQLIDEENQDDKEENNSITNDNNENNVIKQDTSNKNILLKQTNAIVNKEDNKNNVDEYNNEAKIEEDKTNKEENTDIKNENDNNIILNQNSEVINNDKENKQMDIRENCSNNTDDTKIEKDNNNNQLLNQNNEDKQVVEGDNKYNNEKDAKVIKEENKYRNEEDKKIDKEENNNININQEKESDIKQPVDIKITENKISENKTNTDNNINIIDINNTDNIKVKNNSDNNVGSDSSSDNSYSDSAIDLDKSIDSNNNDTKTNINEVQNNDVHNLTMADIAASQNDNNESKQTNQDPEVVTRLLTNNIDNNLANNNHTTLTSNEENNNSNLNNNQTNNNNVITLRGNNQVSTNNDMNTNDNLVNNSNTITLRNSNQIGNVNDTTNLKYTENALYGSNATLSNDNNTVLRGNKVILRDGAVNEEERIVAEPTTQLFNNIGIGTTEEGKANKFTVTNEKLEMDNIRLGPNDKIKIESTNKEIKMGTLAVGHDSEFEYYGEQNDPMIDVVKTPETGKFHIDIAKEGVEKKGGKADWITLDTVMPDTDGEVQPLLRNTNGLLRNKNIILRANGNKNTLLGDPSGPPYNQEIKTEVCFQEDAQKGLELRYDSIRIHNFRNYSKCTFTIVINKDKFFDSSVNGWENKLTKAYYKASVVSENTYEKVKDISTTLLSYSNTSTKYDNTQIRNSNGDEYNFIACEGALYLVKVTKSNEDAIKNALTNNGGVVDSDTLKTILEGAESTDSNNNNPTHTDDPNDPDASNSTDDSDTEMDNHYNQYQGDDFSKLAKYAGSDGSIKSIRETIKNNPASVLATYCADLENKGKSSKGLLNQAFDDDLLDVLLPDNASKKKYWIKGSISGINNNDWNNNSVLLGGDILNKSVLNSNLKLQLVGGTMFGNIKNYSNEYKTREFFVGPKVSFLNKYFTCELLGLYRHNNVAYSKDNKNEFVNNGLSIGGKAGINISLADMFIIQPYIKALHSRLKPNKPIQDLSTTYQFDLASGLAFGFKLPYGFSLTFGYQHNFDPTLKDDKGIDLINNKNKSSNTFGIGINKSVNSIDIGAKVSVDVNNDDNKNSSNNKDKVGIEAQLQVSKLL